MEGELTQFNMGLILIQRLSNELASAFYKYNSGDILGWYFSLKGIKMQIISNLNRNEREHLQALEKAIESNPLIKKIKLSENIDDEDKKKQINSIVCKDVECYNEALQDIMKAKGLLIPAKEDDTHFA